MVIHESAEDYLETILMLSKKLPVVRSIDIANEMDHVISLSVGEPDFSTPWQHCYEESS